MDEDRTLWSMIDIYLLEAFPCQSLPTWCKVCADGYDRML